MRGVVVATDAVFPRSTARSRTHVQSPYHWHSDVTTQSARARFERQDCVNEWIVLGFTAIARGPVTHANASDAHNQNSARSSDRYTSVPKRSASRSSDQALPTGASAAPVEERTAPNGQKLLYGPPRRSVLICIRSQT